MCGAHRGIFEYMELPNSNGDNEDGEDSWHFLRPDQFQTLCSAGRTHYLNGSWVQLPGGGTIVTIL